MTSLTSFFLLHIFLSIASLGTGLRIVELKVPSVVDVRDQATLICKYDIEGEQFFSLKWYKEELEFFRYMPEDVPQILTFHVDGVHISENDSNMSAVVLKPLEYESSGMYRCEVSAGPPHFRVVFGHGNMTVLGLPRENPKITGVDESYTAGSYVTANCTSSPSYPPAKLDWYINGEKAEQWFVDDYHPGQPVDLQLETRTVGLKFQTDGSHFRRSKDGLMSLTCTATVGNQTRSTEMKAGLSTLKREEFAQQFSNRSCSFFPNLFTLIVAITFPRSFEYKFIVYRNCV